ncbi:MAG: cupin domain-containing protein [Alphaproteobacteria bacterium]|nr:cupin domain-containing protein [Alphaproteobacteria bacterium]
MATPIRRVVMGHDATGKAVVKSDGPAPFVHINPRNEDDWSTDLWRTGETPVQVIPEHPETTLGPRRQMPQPNGTVFRINHFAPESEDIRNRTVEEARAAFAALGNEPASTYGRGGSHPASHRTETVDYALILSGEITMIIDDGEIELKAGDVVIQCGTNHAWSNRSDKPCDVMFVLIDGSFDLELKAKFST